MSITPLLPATIGLVQPVRAVASGAVSSFASVLENLTGSSTESDPAASSTDQQSLDSSAPLRLEDLRSQTTAALDQLHTKLKTLFEVSGIDPLQTARLSIQPGDGRLTVSPEHPQAEQIEALINGDPELANSLRQVIANLDLLRAAQSHQEFAAAYQRDPAAALTEFSDLFDKDHRTPLDLLFDIHHLGPEVSA